jgi:CubicO group peptidase (beta-lactamase class C family)
MDLYQALDDFLSPQLGEQFTGAQVAVMHRGAQVLDAAWGVVHPDEAPDAVTSQHRFDLASLSKLFTTTALLQQISSGHIGLESPLVEVIPEFDGPPREMDGGQDPHTRAMLPLPKDMEPRRIDPKAVTFRHLLTHTSGLAPWRAVFAQAGPPPPPPGEIDHLPQGERWGRMLSAMVASRFVETPGTRVRYSDIGLMLVGEAVARLFGMPLDSAILKHVLEPLGLTHLTYNPTRHGVALETTLPTEFDTLWRKRRVWGEVHDENACGAGGVAGHAGMFGNAGDMARFGAAWCAGEVPGVTADLAAQAIVEQAETNGERRGLGWMLRSKIASSAGTQFGPRSFGHTGFTGTSLWIDPDQQLVVALLTNAVYYGRLKPGLLELRQGVNDRCWTALCDPAS